MASQMNKLILRFLSSPGFYQVKVVIMTAGIYHSFTRSTVYLPCMISLMFTSDLGLQVLLSLQSQSSCSLPRSLLAMRSRPYSLESTEVFGKRRNYKAAPDATLSNARSTLSCNLLSLVGRIGASSAEAPPPGSRRGRGSPAPTHHPLHPPQALRTAAAAAAAVAALAAVGAAVADHGTKWLEEAEVSAKPWLLGWR